MVTNILETNRLHLNNIIKDMGEEKITKENLAFEVSYTYDAVGLEGTNKIPYEAVGRLIKVGQIDTYSEREHKEVLNHIKAFDLVKKWVAKDVTLTEEMLKDLHEILVKDIFQGGIYRNLNIQIPAATHQPPDHLKVYDRMGRIFNDNDIKALSNFDKAILVPALIAKIHPFLDGNGRLARLIMNFYLMKAGYIAISVPLDARDEYFACLEEYKVNRNLKPLKTFIVAELNKRYEALIKRLEK